jgi:suppressor of ftsI
MLELRYVRSPFGVAVTPDGRLRHALVARIEGLPDPSSLGPYRAFVAWGYDLTMGRETRLGQVSDGLTVLGELPYEQFRILVSAESSPRAATRQGRIVMRATSPTALLLAHRDAIAPMSAAVGSGGADTSGAASNAGAAHAAHGGRPGATKWPMPPHDPRIAPVAMGHPDPSTAPWLPEAGRRGVAAATPRRVITLRNGDTLRLEATIVRRTIGDKSFIMYGYNGQYPGPLVRVRQGTEVFVDFHNGIDLPTTVHWHGLRLDNRSDGVPHLTQEPVAPGGSFIYRLRFPDAGIYWYHPHVREDIQQDLGLYGNLLVSSDRTERRGAVNREEILALDDMLLDERGVMPYGADTATHALMGRFGNVMLVNGEPRYALDVRRGEVVRFYLTNVASARIFNVRFHGARIKLVASDLGAFEREEWVTSIVIAPAERYVVDVRFDSAGTFAMSNAVQWLDHMRGTARSVQDTMGMIRVSERRALPDHGAAFARLRRDRWMTSELAKFRSSFDRPVDHTLTLGMRLNGVAPSLVGMLVGIAIPLDWNDAMPMMNWPLTAREVTWILRDEQGRENGDIDWRFRQGDVVRIRIANDPTVTHAMAHPIHIHGQRFLVIARNAVRNENLAWKDTAVLPAGETMDILLELSNPGRWMMHCHVAEHLGSGMMGRFEVGKADGRR